MKIAITGANGFVGAALCRYFHQRGHEIIALGSQPSPHPNLLKTAQYIKSDITKVMSEIEADVCIHTAALPSDTDTYKSLIISNVEGTLNVVEAARKCQYFIHISSSSVYEFNNDPQSEIDASLQARLSDYGETKLLAEEIVELNIPSAQNRLILRPRAIYGIGEQLLLPRLLKLITGSRLLCPVPEDVLGSMTHVENIGYGIELFISSKTLPQFSTFNICDEKPYPLQHTMLRTASVLSGKKIKPLSIPGILLEAMLYFNSKTHNYKTVSKPVINSLSKNSILNISRIKSELGYSPTRSYENTLPELSSWIQQLGGIKAYLKALSDAPWAV